MTAQADEDLENRITAALMIWQNSRGPTAIRKSYNEFRKLVAQRSPEAVRKLEEEKGLC